MEMSLYFSKSTFRDGWGGWMIFVHDPHDTIRNEDTFIPDFIVILKHLLQNYYKIWK